MAALVDAEKHPPRRMVPTRGDADGERRAVHWTTVVALVLLGVFLFALPLAGVLGVLEGTRAGVGLLGLAASSLISSYLLGSD